MEPTIPQPVKFQMSHLGLLARSIKMSTVNNPDNKGPDEYYEHRANNNQETWWIALPTELFGAICPTEATLPTTFKGNMFCPRWDKVIFSQSPTLAIFNAFFHATELHVESQQWYNMKLMSFDANTVQMKHRLGNDVVNLFNRGYWIQTQLQLESGRRLNLTTDEMASQQLWDITTVAENGNVLQQVAINTSWQQGFAWMYNQPIPIRQVTDVQHPWYLALINTQDGHHPTSAG